jgi:hypothetical protein
MKNIGAKISLYLIFAKTAANRNGNGVEKKNCYVCDKQGLSKNEIGLTKKLLGKEVKRFYCLDCLAEYLEVDVDILLAKVEEFKEQGCTLF